jgi:hypothetical protein
MNISNALANQTASRYRGAYECQAEGLLRACGTIRKNGVAAKKVKMS